MHGHLFVSIVCDSPRWGGWTYVLTSLMCALLFKCSVAHIHPLPPVHSHHWVAFSATPRFNDPEWPFLGLKRMARCAGRQRWRDSPQTEFGILRGLSMGCPQRTPNVENRRPSGRLDMSGVEGRKRMSQGRVEFYSANSQRHPHPTWAKQRGEACGASWAKKEQWVGRT